MDLKPLVKLKACIPIFVAQYADLYPNILLPDMHNIFMTDIQVCTTILLSNMRFKEKTILRWTIHLKDILWGIELKHQMMGKVIDDCF